MVKTRKRSGVSKRQKSNKTNKSKSRSKSNKTKTRSKSNKVKVIFAKRLQSDDYMKDKEGEYFPEKYYDHIVDYDCDCYYYDENNNKQVLFKFRKNVFPQELCELGIECLK